MTAPAPTPTPAPAAAGPMSGFVYGDVPNRAIAYILDSILIFVMVLAVSAVLAIFSLAAGFFSSLLISIVALAIGAGYFIYTWTRMRATLGMKALGMQVGNAGDGATLTTEQAVKRWLAISAPAIIAQAFAGVSVIGWFLGLAAFAWFVFLVWTTAKSPTKQGWHDVFANSQVVKAARVV